MAKTKWTRRRRLNMDTALLVDTINNEHTPTIPRVDDRYDFLGKPDGVGSISFYFSINDFGIGQGQNYIRLIGNCQDGGGTLNGWMVVLFKGTAEAANGNWTLGFFNGQHPVSWNWNYSNVEIKRNVTYHFVVTKNAGVIKNHLNAVEILPVVNAESLGTYSETTNPILLGGRNRMEGNENRAGFLISHVSFFNKILTEGEIKLIYRHGGVLPESAHESCIGYWPCQEKSGTRLYDRVEQYNNAKEHIAVKNGTFAGSSTEANDWVRGFQGAWSFAGGVATCPAYTGTALYQLGIPMQLGRSYKITFTLISFIGTGNFYVTLGYDTVAGTYNRSGNYTDVGTYSVILTTPPNSNNVLYLQTDGGVVVSVKDVKLAAVSHGPLEANHIHLLGYNGIQDVINHLDFQLSHPDWTYDSVTDTLAQAATSRQNATSVGVEMMVFDTEYCLRFFCTQANGATLIFLNAYGDYSTISGVTLGQNEIYFRGRGGNRISFVNNATPAGGFSAHSFSLEKLPDQSRYLLDKKQIFYPKIKFKDPNKYLEFPQRYTESTALNNSTTGGTFIIDFSGRKLISGTYLYVNNAFSIQVVDGQQIGLTSSPELLIVASIYHDENGSIARATASLGTRTSLKNTRVIITYRNDVSNFRRIKIAVDGVILADTAGDPAHKDVPIKSFGQAAYAFKVSGSDEVEGSFFQHFISAFSDAQIAAFGEYGKEVTSLDLLQYAHASTMNVGSFAGTNVLAGQGITATFKNFTEEELANSIVDYYGQLPELKNAVALLPSVTPIELPKTISSNSENIGMYFTIYVPDDIPNTFDLFFEMNCDGGGFNFYKGNMVIFLDVYYLLMIDAPMYPVLKKGFHSMVFQRKGRELHWYVNGIRRNIGHAGTGVVNEIFHTANPFYFRNITTHKFYNNADEIKIINYGLYEGNLTQKQALDMHNNMQFSNPINLTNWLCYYQFNLPGTSWKDQTGNCANAYCAASLPVATLDSLR
ncbi:hypothetical protein I5M27_10005 [Adhaeribacter sp. BT258]|uniref:Concanavalin A-like lectin/glucanases superfamily protein n=1 Tax=Adhaeribacter terrigena TaxID=2793070 RepID=A0ABS1C1W5_9BACT|nr:hypothetical protein [Adhaeribacter terrigena]MBK0403320.1 hypothetical protein [Adhaeribacter terrigena]